MLNDAAQDTGLFDKLGFDFSDVSEDKLVAAMVEQLVKLLGREKALNLLFFGILELDDTAALLGFEQKTIRNYVARREIPFVPLGRRNVFLRDSLREWLRSKEYRPRGCS